MAFSSVIVQVVVIRWFLIPKTQVQLQAIHTEFVVDELALRQAVFGVYFIFPLKIIIPSMIYYLINHSGLVQTARLRPQCQGSQHRPIPGIKNNAVRIDRRLWHGHEFSAHTIQPDIRQ
jgi:hypothetical protein